METQYKRSFRNYLVSRDLQLRLLAQSFIYVCVMVLAAIGIILYPLIRDMLFLKDLDRQYAAAQTFLSLATWLIPAILTLLALFLGHLILLTHRICGPLINFSHTFDRLAEGDLTRKVHLRRGDYLGRECERINHMIDGISGVIQRLLVEHRQLVATLQGVREQVGDIDTREKIEGKLEMICQQVKQIEDSLAHFTMESREPEK